MQDQSPFNLVVTGAASIRPGLSLATTFRAPAARGPAGTVSATLLLAASQAIAPARQSVDGTAPFQSIQHFVPNTAVRAAHVQAGCTIVNRRRVSPNSQKS